MRSSSRRTDARLRIDELERLVALMEHMVHADGDDPEAVLLALLDRCLVLMGAEGGSIMVLADPHTLVLRVSRGRFEGAESHATVPFGQSIAGRVAETGVGMLVQDIPEGLTGYISKAHPPRSALCVPVRCEDRVVGILNLNLWTPDRRFEEMDLRIARLLAIHVAWVLTLNQRLTEIWQIAKLDGLTGLSTRWHFTAQLEAEIARSLRQGLKFCVVMTDLDEFKQLNTRYGHLAADGVLRDLGAVMQSHIRIMDLVARFGGDEFALLLPETDIRTALQVVGRLQTAVGAHRFVGPGGEVIALSLSAGIAQYPLDGRDSGELLHMADLALMEAKVQASGAVSVETQTG
ncbi:MAG TPA: sensor domain-containing diguanylate cyclase [bacterium]|nr:sensor domain-containing diguanylate cyclase [bacterium]